MTDEPARNGSHLSRRLAHRNGAHVVVGVVNVSQRGRFTGMRYTTRRGRIYASPDRWWVTRNQFGWWDVIPPTTSLDWRKEIKRFPPGTYWTRVLPYINGK